MKKIKSFSLASFNNHALVGFCAEDKDIFNAGFEIFPVKFSKFQPDAETIAQSLNDNLNSAEKGKVYSN